MHSLARHYPDWKAPSEDGKPLIWPSPSEILRDTLDNQKRLATSNATPIQNVPMPQVRARLRQFIGHDNEQPMIANGHQTELYHPGVWAKDCLIHAAAAKIDAAPFHLAVDTDAPKHLTLKWPGGSMPITDDSNITSAAWSGLLSPPTPSHLQQIQSNLNLPDWQHVPMLGGFLNSMRRLSLESLNLSAALTNATHELDWSLGLRHHALLASPIWSSEPFLLFAHDLLAHADSIASHYNNALATYRKQQGISSRMRPMPDLFVSGESIESPFWLDDLHTGKRIRPSVFRHDKGWMLQLTDGQEFLFNKSADGWESAVRLQRWLSSTRHRLSPRALTLTMFVRLLLVDQFVHGIGGARYDQVTDELIASHYEIEPPKFSVTTATMYLPQALQKERVCVPCVKQEGHRLRHGLLGSHKRELVAEIESLPRYSAERSSRFFEMHAALSQAAQTSDVLPRWQEKLRETQQREKDEETLFDRELFYALQPKERLEEMISRYQATFQVV